MVEIRFDKNFISIFTKIKDNFLKEKITKQIKKISNNPEIGKPMKYDRKGTRELYIKPFRLSYSYLKHNNIKKNFRKIAYSILKDGVCSAIFLRQGNFLGCSGTTAP